jgi:ATP-dependent Clp protease protease subunit
LHCVSRFLLHKRKHILASGPGVAQLAGKARTRDATTQRKRYATAAMARLLALLTTAAAYVTQQPKSVAPGRTAPRSKIVLGPQSVPQVPYSPPGAEQGQHMYVDIYQALYRDRIMLVGNFLDEEQANSLIALLLFMRFEDPRKPISIYFNVPGALMKPCLAVYDTLRTLECPVTTVNLGLATGMGAFLCGAGTKGMRYALPNARFLMQRTGLDDPYQGQASDIGLMVRENLRDNDRMARRGVFMISRRWRLRDHFVSFATPRRRRRW